MDILQTSHQQLPSRIHSEEYLYSELIQVLPWKDVIVVELVRSVTVPLYFTASYRISRMGSQLLFLLTATRGRKMWIGLKISGSRFFLVSGNSISMIVISCQSGWLWRDDACFVVTSTGHVRRGHPAQGCDVLATLLLRSCLCCLPRCLPMLCAPLSAQCRRLRGLEKRHPR